MGRASLVLGVTLLAGRTASEDYDAEIRELASRPEIRNAFQIVVELEPRTEKDLIELTEIPAPPFQQAKRAARYAEMLRESGLPQVEIDEVGNVVARLRGSAGAGTVAMVAHLDTVLPQGTDVKVRRDGNRLVAPGIDDDTGGLALVLTVVRAMVRASVQTRDDVLFVASVGEEGLGDLRRVKHLFRRGGPRIDQFIAVDGASTDRVLTHAIGSYRYKVTL